MIRSLILTAALLLTYSLSQAFCGFYVAPAGAELTNKSSQVIIVRDGNHTVITMANDYQGSAQDFAMVVPVPEVLGENDIRIVQQRIFGKLNDYTAPRMAEYYDPTPCQTRMYMSRANAKMSAGSTFEDFAEINEEEATDLGVVVEAEYSVGEYDILILSAKESSGLKTWLTQNNYSLPEGASEVLQPYINDGMKFFVVKVNLDNQQRGAFTNLRPLQIQFNSSKFMLPIRLGMANAKSTQDLVVYALTRNGRVETVNYRTTKIPTDRDIPQFIKTKAMFGEFYEALFEKTWEQEGKNSVMLEYAWDISSQQPVKCDPCATAPIYFSEMREAGVWWISPTGGEGYNGNLFVTRLHVRYGREKFPQDLVFMATPNQEHFQGRYVIHNPAGGTFDCEEGKKYLEMLGMRKRRELDELAALTGWSAKTFKWYLGDAADVPEEVIELPQLPGGGETINRPTGKAPQRGKEATAAVEPAPAESETAITTTATAEMTELPIPAGLTNVDLDTSAEDFLAVAKAEASAPAGPGGHWMLLGIALVMFAGGIGYRAYHRKST